jgi:hypothetical protein
MYLMQCFPQLSSQWLQLEEIGATSICDDVIGTVLITIKAPNPSCPLMDSIVQKGSYLKSSPKVPHCVSVLNSKSTTLTRERLVSWVLRHIIVLIWRRKGVRARRSRRVASSSAEITAEPNTRRFKWLLSIFHAYARTKSTIVRLYWWGRGVFKK